MNADELSSRHHRIAMGKIKAPVSEQRKAIEWRLERQHKWAGRSVVEGDHVIRVEVTRRVAGAPTAAPRNRITAHTNGSGS